tara:strand:+ start:551 stop:847 length:297 start_codon:yes stop_codon:yes gene_type:complete
MLQHFNIYNKGVPHMQKPINPKEKLKKLILQLESYPANMYSKCHEIEVHADGMPDQDLTDEEFNALLDLLTEVDEYCKEQYRLIRSAKILMGIEIQEN